MNCRITDQKEMEFAAMDSDRHSQGDLPGGHGGPAGLTQGLAHSIRRTRRVCRMIPPAEKQQNRVAAPLDEIGAIGTSRPDEHPERAVQDVAHLFRADISLAGKAFSQLGETGDVDEGHRAVDREVPLIGISRQPLDRESRRIRMQRPGRPIGNAQHAHVSPRGAPDSALSARIGKTRRNGDARSLL